jgi:hypothetical protein
MSLWFMKALHDATKDGIDWDAIRGVKMTLDGMAETTAQKEAVRRLHDATADNLHRAISGLSTAFAGPIMFDEKGWPKKNANFAPATGKKKR